MLSDAATKMGNAFGFRAVPEMFDSKELIGLLLEMMNTVENLVEDMPHWNPSLM